MSDALSVDEQQARPFRKLPYRLRHRGSFSEGEEPGDVGEPHSLFYYHYRLDGQGGIAQ